MITTTLLQTSLIFKQDENFIFCPLLLFHLVKRSNAEKPVFFVEMEISETGADMNERKWTICNSKTGPEVHKRPNQNLRPNKSECSLRAVLFCFVVIPFS